MLSQEDEDTSETGDRSQADPSVDDYVASIRDRGAEWLADYARRSSEIEREIADRWRSAFERYDLLVIVVQRTLGLTNQEFYAAAVSRQDVVYEALHALAVRACQIAKEVRALMGKGYAPAAATRWRTLHEVHIVAKLIKMHGTPLAERYLRHNVVEKNKLANAVEEYYRGVSQPVPPEIAEAIAKVRAEYIKLQALYASEPAFFKGDYGWAARLVKGSSIVDLERAARLGSHRYVYRLVSGSVHGNIAGAFAGSLTTPTGEALILGPSSDGMMEPGLSAAASLLETERIFFQYVLNSSDQQPDTKRELAMTILSFDALFRDVVIAFQK